MLLPIFKKIINNIIKLSGYEIVLAKKSDPIVSQNQEFIEIYNLCKPYTMTSRERMYSLYLSIKYIIKAGIPGDFVECGVWKGGNTMLISYILQNLGITNRKIYLYDTFEGMSKPTEVDLKTSKKEGSVFNQWQKQNKDNYNTWCYAGIDEVKQNMFKTGYPQENIKFIQGKVEDTIPNNLPNQIALLRLDTDWYESTKHELIHMFPILLVNGVLIIDDYGAWKGAKKAVDEYFYNKNILFNRIDDTGYIAIKTK